MTRPAARDPVRFRDLRQSRRRSVDGSQPVSRLRRSRRQAQHTRQTSIHTRLSATYRPSGRFRLQPGPIGMIDQCSRWGLDPGFVYSQRDVQRRFGNGTCRAISFRALPSLAPPGPEIAPYLVLGQRNGGWFFSRFLQPHRELMQYVARQSWIGAASDQGVAHGSGRRAGGGRETAACGGKQTRRGTPQGGVISPLLANLYMNRFLKHWRQTGKGQRYAAIIVNYADAFVILSRGHAEEAREWTGQVMTRIGLTLNEAKTSIKSATSETFNFLRYTFGPQRY